MSLIVIGFRMGLLDFWAFWLCTYFASLHYRPAEFYRWVWFVGFVLLAFLFLIAWLVDLGARL